MPEPEKNKKTLILDVDYKEIKVLKKKIYCQRNPVAWLRKYGEGV
jgi:hypothetical protein